MARIPSGVTTDEYGELPVVARRVLLDGIEALRDHQDAITVVGAQAVYLRSRDVRLAVPIFTTDADFGIDPRHLEDAPLLEQAVGSAGFFLRDPDQPGLWAKHQLVGNEQRAVGLDLLVGGTFAGEGRRAARLPPHGRRVARRVDGLEAAVVDADVLSITSLEPAHDQRALSARVAGPAALLVAKAHKIAERVAEGQAGPHRRQGRRGRHSSHACGRTHRDRRPHGRSPRGPACRKPDGPGLASPPPALRRTKLSRHGDGAQSPGRRSQPRSSPRHRPATPCESSSSGLSGRARIRTRRSSTRGGKSAFALRGRLHHVVDRAARLDGGDPPRIAAG